MRAFVSYAIEIVLVRRPKNAVDLVYLIQFIAPREQRLCRQELKEHASNAPYVHFVGIATFSQQAFWRPVPPGRDVLGVLSTLPNSPRASKICQLHHFIREENILWLDIPMKHSSLMHVVHGPQNLINHFLRPHFILDFVLTLHFLHSLK